LGYGHIVVVIRSTTPAYQGSNLLNRWFECFHNDPDPDRDRDPDPDPDPDRDRNHDRDRDHDHDRDRNPDRDHDRDCIYPVCNNEEIILHS
jgi:hypothetical protein